MKVKVKKPQEKRIVRIKTDFIKLDALLKLAGIADTGGHAKQLIEQGNIQVCGQQCLMRGKKIRPSDTVAIGDLLIEVAKGED